MPTSHSPEYETLLADFHHGQASELAREQAPSAEPRRASLWLPAPIRGSALAATAHHVAACLVVVGLRVAKQDEVEMLVSDLCEREFAVLSARGWAPLGSPLGAPAEPTGSAVKSG